jgi:hypothetical protein
MATEKHIPQRRLIEISDRRDDFTPEERMHIANCERCAGLLGALFKSNSDEKNLPRASRIIPFRKTVREP